MSDKNFKVKNGIDSTGPVTITTPNTSTTGLVINVPVGGKAVEFLRNGSYVGAIDDWGGLNTTQGINAAGFWFTRSPGIEAQSFFWAGSSTRSAAGFGGTSTGTNPVIYISSHSTGTNDLTQWLKPDNTIVAKVDYLGNITANDLTLAGNLTVNGTTTNLNSTNLIIEDKNIIIADVATPSDTTADGAGITVKGATDKTFNWVQSTKSFTTSDPLIINNTSTTTVPLIAKGYASQTANHFEVQDSAGNKMFVVNPPAGTLQPLEYFFVRPGGTGGTATIGTNSYSFRVVAAGGNSVSFGTPGGGTSLQVVTSDTFNRYKIIGSGTGIAPTFTTDGNDANVNMYVTAKGAGKIGINTTSPTGYVHAVSSSSSTVGLIVEGASGQTSTNIFEVQRAGGGDPSFNVSHNYIDLNRNTTAAASMTVYGPNAGAVPLYVKGRASQTANLQEWQDSAGTVLAKVNPNGVFHTLGSVYTPYIQPASPTGVNAFIALDNTTVLIDGWSASTVKLTVKGYASQTADLQQWWDSSSNVLTKVDSSGAIYLINPTANNNANDTPSPAINFQGNIWNSAYGNLNIKGAIKVAAYTGNTNPTISKMSFLLATDNGTPAEVASFTNTGAFSNIGGLDAYGSSVIFRLRNTTAPANSESFSPSPKLELMGRGWNSSEGASPSRAYLQVNVNNTNSNPFINRLGVFVATGNNAGGYNYGADATEYMSILGNGTVGINTATPLGTLDIRPISASNKGIVIKGAASQTANLQEWQRSGGNADLVVTNFGTLISGGGTTIASNPTINAYGAAMKIASGVNTYPMLIIQGAASQTANLTEWQNSSGALLTSIGADGRLYVNNTINVSYVQNAAANGPYFSFSSSNITANAFSSTTIPLIIKGAASQSANLQEWQNSAGGVLSYITASGALRVNSSFGGTQAAITAGSAATVGVIVRGAASQTADLQQWQDSSGTVLTTIDSSGKFVIGRGAQLASAVFTVQGNTSTYSPDNTSALANRIIFLRGNTGGNLMALASKGDAAQGVAALAITNGGFSTEIIGFGYNGNIYTNIQSASTVGLTIKAAASQTANLQEWQNSSGTMLSKIDKDGIITVPAINVVGQSISSNTTMIAGYRYFVDTSASRTLTLPSSATIGDEIQIFDSTNTAGTNNITINSNNGKIEGVVESYIIDVNGAAIVMTYTGSTYGWKVRM